MIDRAPVFEIGIDTHDATEAMKNSQTTWDMVMAHGALVAQQLGIGTRNQFEVDEDALWNRLEMLAESKETVHYTSRGIHQLALNLGTTVGKVEDEFRGKQVLDIGCGEGRLGLELEKKSRARVTYVDTDAELIESIQTRRGDKFVEDALKLPFDDGRFARTIGLYAAHIWVPDPVDSMAALLEQLRVTQEGGTAITVPLFTNIIDRQERLGYLDSVRIHRGETVESQEAETKSLKVWDMRDYLVINALNILVSEGYLDMTWTSIIGRNVSGSASIEVYSAVLDVKRQVDREVISDLITGGEELAYSKDASTKEIVERVMDLPTSKAGLELEDHEVWEGGIEGARFTISRHVLPEYESPCITMTVSGRRIAVSNLISRFTRALGEYSFLLPSTFKDDGVVVAWVLDPDVEEEVKKL